jgi:ComF family protein
MLDDFKFKRAYHIHHALARLLHHTVPLLPPETVIVPIPTIARHVRIRGYDHTSLIARAFAKRRGLRPVTLLTRATNSIQLGRSATERLQQASVAYNCRHRLAPQPLYVLIDDIVTTGATLTAAAECLKKAGAEHIMVAAVARQVLEKS